MFLLGNDFVMILLVSLAVVVAVYQYADQITTYLEKRSLGSRDEIVRLLDLMFVEVDRKKITMGLLLMSFGLGSIVFLALLPNVWLGAILGCVVTVGGWSFPPLIVRGMFDRRSDLLVSQMVDGLTIMANGIKSGLSVTQSMERVVENLPNPISQEFGLVLSQIRLGRSVEEALVDFGERIPKADVQMFVTAINILKETGGNLAETFTTIVVTIRERQKIEKKIQAMTAQGLMQGIIISLVPILLILMFLMIDPTYVKPMFNTTFGLILLFMMFALQIIGGITIRKIVKIKV
jgi:tight adherence protein B